jgi:uncharacterized protein (DUF885 family)
VRRDATLLACTNMRQLVFGLVLSLAFSAFGQTVADRVAKQNELFEQYYQAGLRDFPERATQYGDYRYNSQLGQVSLADIARQHAEADTFLARLKAIPTDGMSDNALLSHRILEKQLEREDVNYALKNYAMPVNQQNGVHTRLADLPNAVPLDSVAHYQDSHFPIAPHPAGTGTNDRGDAAGRKGSPDAAQAGCRKVARSMRRRHRREPVP